MAPKHAMNLWKYVGPLAAPLVLLAALALTLWEPITSWLEGHEKYDEEALREWIQQSRNEYRTLGSLTEAYFDEWDRFQKIRGETESWFRKWKVADVRPRAGNPKRAIASAKGGLPLANFAKGVSKSDGRPLILEKQPIEPPGRAVRKTAVKHLLCSTRELKKHREKVIKKQEDVQKFLQWLAEPVTKVHKSRLPLFPVIYQIKVFQNSDQNKVIAHWDSRLPRKEGNFRRFNHAIKIDDKHTAHVYVEYHFRLFASRQDISRQEAANQVYFRGLIALAVTLLLFWVFFAFNRARQREWLLNEAKRKHLEEELPRQEAEQKHQEAERSNLELKSQLWANIGIMAGSYAHNIKNLLVRPNDLLSRCLEVDGLSRKQDHMLNEVRQTLGTVTERLQQILQTIRRDPSQAKRERIDLNALVHDLRDTWHELAKDKWLLEISAETTPNPLWIQGDKSQLQQTIENLLFNARDATFERRNDLRDRARSANSSNGGTIPAGSKNDSGQILIAAQQTRRQALIEAAGWQGRVTLRTYAIDGRPVLEIQDNGIGMSEEVRQRCTETHFTTKRNNALFAGMSAGMGLGLSFIQVILEHHNAKLSIDSEPQEGATFRIEFDK